MAEAFPQPKWAAKRSLKRKTGDIRSVWVKLTENGVPFYPRKVEVRLRIHSLLPLLHAVLPSAGRSSNW
jgi:hypothetical protein